MPVVQAFENALVSPSEEADFAKLKLLDEIRKRSEEATSLVAREIDPAELAEDLRALEESAEDRRAQSFEEYKDMIHDTSEIKLSRLISTREGCDVFDELCLRIDVNQKYAEILPQWKDLADLLRVDQLRTQWVETCVRPKEGHTRAMLEIYTKDGGTLGDVLDALLSLECLDILETIKPKVKEYLANKDKLEIKEDFDGPNNNEYFFSILKTLAAALPGKKDPCAGIQNFAFGLKHYQESHHGLTQQHSILIQGSGNGESNYDAPKLDFPKYNSSLHLNEKRVRNDWKEDGRTCRILMVFAEDGVTFSEDVRSLMQGFEHEGVRAEVFRMNEVSLWYEVLTNPEACCMKWANEADYIVPILTPQLLRDFHSGANENIDSLTPTSPVLNRFMYTLLRARYTDVGCRNTMVRPVIPLPYLRPVGQSQIVRRDPLLRLVWVPQRDERIRSRLRGMLAEHLRRSKLSHE